MCIDQPNAMEFRRLWINHILKKDVNAKLDQNGSDLYLPPFDTTNLFEKMMTESDEQKDGGDDAYQSLKCGEILLCSDFDTIPEIKDTAFLASQLGGVTILRS